MLFVNGIKPMNGFYRLYRICGRYSKIIIFRPVSWLGSDKECAGHRWHRCREDKGKGHSLKESMEKDAPLTIVSSGRERLFNNHPEWVYAGWARQDGKRGLIGYDE